MRTARFTTAILLAAALTACGSNDNTPGGGGTGGTGAAGGSGGTGGDGGTGGTGGGEPTVDCRGKRVIELDGSTSPVVLNDTLDSADNWVGTCTPEDTVGNDVMVHFTAGDAGFYRFSTAGTSFDTLLYALRDCRNGFTELMCKDDVGTSKQSELGIQLEAGQQIFIAVDSVNVRQAEPFTFTAERLEVTPAIVDTFVATYNENLAPPRTGFRVTGTNVFSPLVAFKMQAYLPDGRPIFSRGGTPAALEATFAEIPELAQGGILMEMNVTQVEGEFVIEGYMAFDTAEPIPVGEIELQLVDEFDLVSDVSTAETISPPLRERGADCDRNQALDVCGPNDACVMREPATSYTCEVATAPTIATATVSVNPAFGEFGGWGVVVTGSDPESDTLYARVLPRNAEGNAISVAPTGRTLVGYHHSGHDENGNFRGVALLPAQFDGPCLGPAQQFFNNCGNTQACYDQAIAMLVQCYEDTLPLVTTVDVELVDATGRVSGIIEATVSPVATVEEGASCDPYGITAMCPASNVCWAEDDFAGETCHADGPSCPAEFGVIDLMAHASGAKWIYTGDNSEGTAHGAASCGGGGPTDVLGFTAPAAGNYLIATGDLGRNVDTVVSVRSFCQLPAYELKCSDNFGASAISRLTVTLEEGQDVFIFVDSLNGQATGEYTLTVSRM